MNGMFRDRVTITRPTKATSSAGIAGEGAPSTVATNVACAIQPRSGFYRQQQEGREHVASHRGFFGSAQDIRVGDRLEHDAAKYLVTFVGNFSGHHLEVDLELVNS